MFRHPHDMVLVAEDQDRGIDLAGDPVFAPGIGGAGFTPRHHFSGQAGLLDRLVGVARASVLGKQRLVRLRKAHPMGQGRVFGCAFVAQRMDRGGQLLAGKAGIAGTGDDGRVEPRLRIDGVAAAAAVAAGLACDKAVGRGTA